MIMQLSFSEIRAITRPSEKRERFYKRVISIVNLFVKDLTCYRLIDLEEEVILQQNSTIPLSYVY